MGDEAATPRIAGTGRAGTTRTTTTILGARMASMVLVFVGSVALARALGPEGRGAHAFVVSAALLLAALLALGAPTGSYVLGIRGRAPAGALASIAGPLALLAGIAASMLAVLGGVAGIVPAPLEAVPGWPAAIGAGTAGFVLNSHQLQHAFARGRAVTGALVGLAPYLVAAVAYVAIWAMGAGLSPAIYAYAAAPWLATFGALLVRAAPLPVAWPPLNVAVAAASIRQGLRNYPGELAAIIQQRADVLLLAALAPTGVVGVYVVAYQTAEPILAVASAAGATVLALGPTGERRDSEVPRILRETAVITAALAALAALLAPWLLPLVYGSAFADAVGPFLVLLPAVASLTVARVATTELVRRDRLGVAAVIALSAAALNIGLNLLLIPIAGAIGAAAASCASYTVHAGLVLTACRAAGAFRWTELRPRLDDARSIAIAMWPRRGARRGIRGRGDVG